MPLRTTAASSTGFSRTSPGDQNASLQSVASGNFLHLALSPRRYPVCVYVTVGPACDEHLLKDQRTQQSITVYLPHGAGCLTPKSPLRGFRVSPPQPPLPLPPPISHLNSHRTGTDRKTEGGETEKGGCERKREAEGRRGGGEIT